MRAKVLRLGLLASLVSGASLASGVTIYLEDFTFNGTSQDVVDYGWHYNLYSFGSWYDETSYPGVANVATGGYAFVGGGGTLNDVLFYTDEFLIDRTANTNLSLNWYNQGDSSNEKYRAAIRIGTQWYATTNFKQIGTGSLSFSFDAENWSILNNDPNGSITLGAATPLPSGNADAFGMLVIDQIGNLRYDNVAVNAGAAPPNQWAFDISGSWNTPANWTSSTVPNAIDAAGRLWGNITTAQTVYSNLAITLGTLSFDSANSYQLTGQGSLTMDVSAGAARIEVLQGGHKINLPLLLNDNTTASVAAGATLTIADPLTISAGTTLSKTGSGVLKIVSTVDGSGTLAVSGGAVNLDYGMGVPAGASSAAVAGPAISVLGSQVKLGANQTVIGLDAVTANAGDQEIDLNGRSVRVYTADRAAAEQAIYNDIKAARLSASGKDGIYDSTIASSNYAVGVTDQAVDAHGDHFVVVKKTILGDANVDGTVDVIDLGMLATSWQTSGLWDNGDSNFDGFIDVIDLGMLATNWQQSASGPGLGEALAAYGLPGVSVPEPASILLIGLAAALAHPRRLRLRRTSGR